MANMRMATNNSRPICSRGIIAFIMDLSTTCRPGRHSSQKQTIRGHVCSIINQKCVWIVDVDCINEANWYCEQICGFIQVVAAFRDKVTVASYCLDKKKVSTVNIYCYSGFGKYIYWVVKFVKLWSVNAIKSNILYPSLWDVKKQKVVYSSIKLFTIYDIWVLKHTGKCAHQGTHSTALTGNPRHQFKWP